MSQTSKESKQPRKRPLLQDQDYAAPIEKRAKVSQVRSAKSRSSNSQKEKRTQKTGNKKNKAQKAKAQPVPCVAYQPERFRVDDDKECEAAIAHVHQRGFAVLRNVVTADDLERLRGLFWQYMLVYVFAGLSILPGWVCLCVSSVCVLSILRGFVSSICVWSILRGLVCVYFAGLSILPGRVCVYSQYVYSQYITGDEPQDRPQGPHDVEQQGVAFVLLSGHHQRVRHRPVRIYVGRAHPTGYPPFFRGTADPLEPL